MKLIVGLGNPGPQYRNTRHNVGFLVVEELARRWGVAFDQEKHGALLARAQHRGSVVWLLKPLTFMNRSGIAVAGAARNRVPDLGDLLVIVDDVNLPLGQLRMREKGSAGGHNGLKSCIEHLGTQEFPRLRIGVGENEAGSDLTDHVLGTFCPQERPAVERSVERAANGVALFVESGVHSAMNEVNTKPVPGA
ncbi:MAG: aminoacyl-tRNA hydrolase [Candidatus Hydrogenedentes bacterium]|nr:aminoacyl-tRNA hydrolase [Candidatus Hydrogenedentota bacterium]